MCMLLLEVNKKTLLLVETTHFDKCVDEILRITDDESGHFEWGMNVRSNLDVLTHM